MSGKVWFVTGASRGFGRVWTEAALKRGDQVVATARDPDTLAPLQAAHGDAILALPLDVTDREAVFAMVHRGQQHFGRLDVILSNAGYGYVGAVEELALADIRANFETNLLGTISVVQAALPILRAQSGGHILTVSSVAGLISLPTGGSYTATKFAVECMSEALAGEVAGFGIKVTIIEPGAFATDFDSGLRFAPPIESYAPVREAVLASFKSMDHGDPAATADAIFKVIDAEKPPLRLVLGSAVLPLVRAAYQARLKAWSEWEAVSNAAQGAHRARG